MRNKGDLKSITGHWRALRSGRAMGQRGHEGSEETVRLHGGPRAGDKDATEFVVRHRQL